MEYGTWQARAEEERREQTTWEGVIRTLRRFTGRAGFGGSIDIDGFSCNRHREGWRWCWRACINGERKVAFVDTANLVEGLAVFFRRLDRGGLKWYPDKYAQK